ncbi:MAG: hypothetical protein AB7T10_00665 [bacterium]
MKQIMRKIEITLTFFNVLAALSIIEMTYLDGSMNGSKESYTIDKNNTVFQNE